MAISLEELQQQREQLQKHLEWLDAKISEVSPSLEAVTPERDPLKQVAPQEAPAASLPIAPSCGAAADEGSTETPTTPPLASGEQVLDTPKPTAPPLDPDLESTYKPKTQGDIQRAKVGCLVLFVLATALFLFLLFGLPYLL